MELYIQKTTNVPGDPQEAKGALASLANRLADPEGMAVLAAELEEKGFAFVTV